jgi:hypothetical protein
VYQNLLAAVKTRILTEVEDAFTFHPAYSGKVKVTHKYPYTERVQYGVVLRNTSSSMLRTSADNYMADNFSHVRLALDNHYPGLAIEWARENDFGVTGYVKDEDVSSQLGPTQRMFFTSKQMVSGDSNTAYANNIGQVKVTINGQEVMPQFVDGEKKIVLLSRATSTTDVVLVSYFYRSIADPGDYIIDFTEDNEFTVVPVYMVDQELLIENATGTETSASTEHAGSGIVPTSDMLYMKSRNGGPSLELTRGVDYTIDYTNGNITLLSPITVHYNLYADYRWQPLNYYNGPYTFQAYQENHTAVPGAVIAIGRRAKKGDRQVVVISKFREQQAMIYGGYWDMSMELAVIAKDPIQSAEMADLVISYLWGKRKNILELEGITLMSMEPSGESEEPFDENTGDMYYVTSVSMALQTGWQEFVPYAYAIKRVMPNIQYTPGMPGFYVTKDNKLELTEITPDTRKVIKYPTQGYERVI